MGGFHLKKFAFGVVMTMATFAVGIFLINRFAPPEVKKYFVVA